MDMSIVKAKPNKKLVVCREAAGFTMRQLAKKSKVSLSTINRLEHGLCVPLFPTLEKLAKTLKVEVSQITGK